MLRCPLTMTIKDPAPHAAHSPAAGHVRVVIMPALASDAQKAKERKMKPSRREVPEEVIQIGTRESIHCLAGIILLSLFSPQSHWLEMGSAAVSTVDLLVVTLFPLLFTDFRLRDSYIDMSPGKANNGLIADAPLLPSGRPRAVERVMRPSRCRTR